MTPLVSIALPTYNGMPYLPAALESVLAQQHAHLEVLACDDQSRDGSWAYLAGVRDARLQPQQNATRLGLVGNWNHCLQRANGAFLAVMHQDDLWLPSHLSHAIAMLEANPQISFVYCNIRQIDANGQDVGGHWLPTSQPAHDVVLDGLTCARRMLGEGNFVCMPSVVMRRSALLATGLFDERLPFTVDLEMWLRLCEQGAVGYLAQPTVHYRQHGSQETQRFGAGREVAEFAKAARCFLDRQTPTVRAELQPVALANLLGWAKRMARWQLRQGKVKAAFGHLQVWWQIRQHGMAALPPRTPPISILSQ